MSCNQTVLLTKRQQAYGEVERAEKFNIWVCIADPAHILNLNLNNQYFIYTFPITASVYIFCILSAGTAAPSTFVRRTEASS